MAIILKQDHPAFIRLQNQDVPVRAETGAIFPRTARGPVRAETGAAFSCAAHGQTPVRLGFVNLMPTIYLDETVDLLLNRMARAEQDVKPVFIHPTDARKGIGWAAAKGQVDCILVTGYAASNAPFHELDFWDGLTEILDDAQTLRLPVFAVCAGAMAAAHHYYGIAKEQAAHKLLGNYDYKTRDGQSLHLATSRHNTLNRRQLLDAIENGPYDGHALRIEAETHETPQPEPALLADPAHRRLFALAHLEYGTGKNVYPDLDDKPRDILTYQYDRDHNRVSKKYDPALAARVKPPVHPDLTREQIRARERYAETLLSGWLETAAEARAARELVADTEPAAIVATPAQILTL